MVVLVRGNGEDYQMLVGGDVDCVGVVVEVMVVV